MILYIIGSFILGWLVGHRIGLIQGFRLGRDKAETTATSHVTRAMFLRR